MPDISPDPGDDPFCACAETGRADFVATLNPKDFPQMLLSAHVIKPDRTPETTSPILESRARNFSDRHDEHDLVGILDHYPFEHLAPPKGDPKCRTDINEVG